MPQVTVELPHNLIGNKPPRYMGEPMGMASEKRVLTFAILGDIGEWWGSVGKTNIFNLLQNTGSYDEIHCLISSPGGSADDAFVIYDLIKAHAAKTVCWLTGLVASSGTIIACAFDEVNISSQCVYMIHKGWNDARGNADELRKMAEVLDTTDSIVTKLYSRKTGLGEDVIREYMTNETWFEASQAAELRFADNLVDNISLDFSTEVLVPAESGSRWDFWFQTEGNEIAQASRINMRQRGFNPHLNKPKSGHQSQNHKSEIGMQKFIMLFMTMLSGLGLAVQDKRLTKDGEEYELSQLENTEEGQKFFQEIRRHFAKDNLSDLLAEQIPSMEATVQKFIVGKLEEDGDMKKAIVGSLEKEFQQKLNTQKDELAKLKTELFNLKMGTPPESRGNGKLPASGGQQAGKAATGQNGDDREYAEKLVRKGLMSQTAFDKQYST